MFAAQFVASASVMVTAQLLHFKGDSGWQDQLTFLRREIYKRHPTQSRLQDLAGMACVVSVL